MRLNSSSSSSASLDALDDAHDDDDDDDELADDDITDSEGDDDTSSVTGEDDDEPPAEIPASPLAIEFFQKLLRTDGLPGSVIREFVLMLKVRAARACVFSLRATLAEHRCVIRALRSCLTRRRSGTSCAN